MVDIPDFTLKPTFPVASVIDAAQRNNYLQEQARQAGNQSLIQGLQSIGQIGQSIVDRRRSIAQSLALGRALDIPDEQAKLMEPDQVIHAATIKQGQGSVLQYMMLLHPELTKNPTFMAAISPNNQSAAPVSTDQPTQSTPGAILASDTTAPQPQPSPLQDLLKKPITKGTLNMVKVGMANRPEPVMTTDQALTAGTVPKGTRIVSPKSDTGSNSDKTQNALEQQYRTVLEKPLSNRSGGLGLEDSKVDQAIHLRKAINSQYDPKTGQYNIPPSMHSEIALGLARLMSPNGQVGVQLENELRQKTAKEGLANTLIYMGFDPKQIGGTTQSVAKFFVDQIDRQGQTAEQNRQGYLDYLKSLAPTGLDPARQQKLESGKLNSFSDLLAQSPDKNQAPQSSDVLSVGGTFHGQRIVGVRLKKQ